MLFRNKIATLSFKKADLVTLVALKKTNDATIIAEVIEINARAVNVPFMFLAKELQ